MKNLQLLALALVIALFTACKGSDAYRGSWKALDRSGNKVEINFDAKTFVVQDSAGKKTNFEYTQNSVKIANSVKTYGIKLGDGRAYFINFPNSKKNDVAIIKDANGQPLYVMSRNAYITYDDIYKLQ